MYGQGRGRIAPLLFFLPGLLLFLVFTLGPSLFTAVLSFTDISGFSTAPWHFVGFSNYRDFFGSSARDNIDALKHTFVFSALFTIAQNVLALLFAIVLNGKLRGVTFFRTIIFLPVILGFTITGLIWIILLNPQGGPIENVLHVFHGNSALLGSYTEAFPLVIIIQVWASVGFAMIIYLAGLQGIPLELNEAGVVDGTSAWQRFRFITFPLLAPSVTVNLLLSVIGSLQTYQLIYVLTSGGFNTTVLSLKIFFTAFGSPDGSAVLRQGYASAMTILQFFIILVIALVIQTYLRRREVQL